MPLQAKNGFTLIELSIVLVIIGLVIGGVLTGRDLIKSSEVRAQIAQIEKFSTAANTFKAKYGYLPGDIADPAATNYGFAARGLYAGEGDGNGILQGVYQDAPSSNGGASQSAGETIMFWVDLSAAGLIEGSFTSGTPTNPQVVTQSQIPNYFPPARIGHGNYLYVFSSLSEVNNNLNYFGLSIPTGMTGSGHGGGAMSSVTGLTVQEAYNLDSKIDDGQPLSGRVVGEYVNSLQTRFCCAFAGPILLLPLAGSSSTCYDNGNTFGVAMHYSTSQNSTGTNCAVSFQFQ